jgi:hypothetical protein
MGAHSDTPSSRQVADLLREVKQLNRTADRIQGQLSTAGLALYYVGLLALFLSVMFRVARVAVS